MVGYSDGSSINVHDSCLMDEALPHLYGLPLLMPDGAEIKLFLSNQGIPAVPGHPGLSVHWPQTNQSPASFACFLPGSHTTCDMMISYH